MTAYPPGRYRCNNAQTGRPGRQMYEGRRSLNLKISLSGCVLFGPVPWRVISLACL